jgi:DNA-binding helix-hairpin-helix protein with protein kinase domain
VDQPPLREGRLVRTWIAALGGEVLHEVDLPACCRRSARSSSGGSFECPSCGAMWQTPLPVEPEGCAFTGSDMEERKGAA